MSLIRIFSLGICLCLASSAYAYSPPRGIPDPGNTWGTLHPIDSPVPIRENIAPGWFEATPRVNSTASGDAHDCYYVDNSSASATDSSNTYGSPTKPRLTIPNKIFTAGSYIEIHGDGATGTYQYSTVTSPRGAGTDRDPIWFVGINQPILSGKLDIGAADNPGALSYMLFDGLRWQNGSKVDIRPRFTNNTIDHISFRNCAILGTGTLGIGGFGAGTSSFDPTQTTTDIVIYNCEIAYAGDKNNPGEECGV